MSQAQVDNFVRKLQKLQGDSAKLREGYQKLQEEVIEFCNEDDRTASLFMALISDVAAGKVKNTNVYVDVTADGAVTIGHRCKPVPDEENAETKEVVANAE